MLTAFLAAAKLAWHAAAEAAVMSLPGAGVAPPGREAMAAAPGLVFDGELVEGRAMRTATARPPRMSRTTRIPISPAPRWESPSVDGIGGTDRPPGPGVIRDGRDILSVGKDAKR